MPECVGQTFRAPDSLCASDGAFVITVSVIGEEGVASPRRNPPAAFSSKRACVRHQSGDTNNSSTTVR